MDNGPLDCLEAVLPTLLTVTEEHQGTHDGQLGAVNAQVFHHEPYVTVVDWQNVQLRKELDQHLLLCPGETQAGIISLVDVVLAGEVEQQDRVRSELHQQYLVFHH